MIPGGHAEPGESQVDAALREVEEETGRRVRLVRPPGPAVPADFPRTVLTMPWWITEQPVPPDGYCGDRHVHVDHQYFALVTDPDAAVREPEHPFRWAGGAGGARRPRDVRRHAAAGDRLVRGCADAEQGRRRRGGRADVAGGHWAVVI
ncbi:NUDIX domain-containing protein [Amycolatopsis sp. NPDC051716]|uniref:NUDIX domain-containing protein n=1 Tax=Amycolatopsis sp. NPDC051716 TaxID=3155804 RepID=UPI0034496BFA